MNGESCPCTEEYFELDESTFRWLLNGRSDGVCIMNRGSNGYRASFRWYSSFRYGYKETGNNHSGEVITSFFQQTTHSAVHIPFLYPRKVQGFLARNVDLNFFDSARY